MKPNGSSLFSVARTFRYSEFPGDEVEHAGYIFAVAKAPSFSFYGAEDTIESLHKGGAQFAQPVVQNAVQVLPDCCHSFGQWCEGATQSITFGLGKPVGKQGTGGLRNRCHHDSSGDLY